MFLFIFLCLFIYIYIYIISTNNIHNPGSDSGRRKGTIRTPNPRKSPKSTAEISNRLPESQIDWH